MRGTEQISTLRKVLANLYPTPAASCIIIQDIGMDLTHIDLSGSALIIWNSILQEAVKHSGMIERLIEVVLEDYPTHEPLVAIASSMPVSSQKHSAGFGVEHPRGIDELYQVKPVIDEFWPGQTTYSELKKSIAETPQVTESHKQRCLFYPKTGLEFRLGLLQTQYSLIVTNIIARKPYSKPLFRYLKLGLSKTESISICQQLFRISEVSVDANAQNYRFPGYEANFFVRVGFESKQLSFVQLFWHPNPQADINP